MALVNDAAIEALATSIVNDIIGGSLPAAEKAIIVAAKKKELKKLMEYLVANAQVATTVAVASVSGVTAGPVVSGPGTGSGTGTIT